MIETLIYDIIDKYYNENSKYYGSERYENGEFIDMEEELEEALTTQGIEHKISTQYGFSSPGYENSFLAVAYIDKDGTLGQVTVLLEEM